MPCLGVPQAYDARVWTESGAGLQTPGCGEFMTLRMQDVLRTCLQTAICDQHVGAGVLPSMRLGLIPDNPAQACRYLSAGVDDVNLVEADHMQHLLSPLQLAIWALHELGGRPCKSPPVSATMRKQCLCHAWGTAIAL